MAGVLELRRLQDGFHIDQIRPAENSGLKTVPWTARVEREHGGEIQWSTSKKG
jgi:hypothetical protein